MNQLLNEFEKQNIILKLNEKGIRTNCPMCGNDKFVIADGYFLHYMQAVVNGGLSLGGPSIPTIAIVCERCGFTSQHALGVLGLLPQNDKK